MMQFVKRLGQWQGLVRRPPAQHSGEYALITGASQGLGRAMAQECAQRGMNLILVALPGSRLGQVAQEVAQQYGVEVEFTEMDLTTPGSPEKLCDWVVESEFDLAVLINNAGVGYNSRFEDSTLGQNEVCILLNNLALVKITRLLLPVLKQRGSGHILNVASLAALFPMPYMPVYAPSKAFILSFSLALRAEMQGSGVNVSVLCPNGIRTNGGAKAMIESGGLAARLTCLDPQQVAGCAIRGMFAGRAMIVPGPLNQMISAVAKFVPRGLVYGVVAAFWGKTARQGQFA